MKVRSPEKFLDVCDGKMTDVDGLKERIWINRVASGFVFQPFIQTPRLCCAMNV